MGDKRYSALSRDSMNYLNIGYVYKHDQLNRLTGQLAFNNVDSTNNKWKTTAAIDD